MKARTKAALLVIGSLSLLSAASIKTVASWKASPQTDILPPLEVARVGSPTASPGRVILSDLKGSWLTWDTYEQQVTLIRRERQNTNSEWDEQEHPLATSFYILDARAGCSAGNQIKTLFVAGQYPNGDACIEKWVFKYKTLPFGYVPISQRPLPKVTRTELFRGTQYGRIRSVQPDPGGEYLLFLTFENPALYKFNISSGQTELLLTQANAPYLAVVTHIVVRQHTTEGRHYHLMKGQRWEVDLTEPLNVIVAIDNESDGVFESIETLSMTEWESRGYSPLHGPFLDPCQ